MLKIYLKTAWRAMAKHPLYTAVNIAGLAIGLASFSLVLLYLNYEVQYDKWNPALEKVYKIGLQSNGDIMQGTPAPLADFLTQNVPGVEAATAIMPSGDYKILVAAGDKKIYQDGIVFADSNFLRVFPYALTVGNRATALSAPNACLISEALTHKLFGNENPVGKSIQLYNNMDCLVTGVLRQPAGPSHLQVEMLFRDPGSNQNKFWENFSFHTYIKVKQPQAPASLAERINRIFYTARLSEGREDFEAYRKSHSQSAFFADAVANLHNFPLHGSSPFKITLVLFVLSLFLLVAGAINFSNLALARAATRAKEVGVRKVLGSRRPQIIIQAMLETGLQCLLSLLFAFLLVALALPYVSQTFNLPLYFLQGASITGMVLQVAAVFIFIVLIAGLYPALFLARFKTVEVLKGAYSSGSKGVFFRNSLLVVQLTISAIFITGTIVINRQMAFVAQKDLGFNATQVLRIEAIQKTREANFEQSRNTLMNVPGVAFVSKSTAVPGSSDTDTTTGTFKFAGREIRLNSVKVSVDYFRTLGITLLQGRLFEAGRSEDLDNTAIINESALKKLQSPDVVGAQIRLPYCDSLPYTIVGVVKDFNVQGLQATVQSVIYSISNAHCGYQSGGAVLVKLSTSHLKKTIAQIEQAWKGIEPDFPIRYSFLDQDFQRLYREQNRLSAVVLFFTLVSVAIAMICLFALTAFLAQQRVKEIGIRKVLGASVIDITTLLSKDFIRLVLIAVVVALPIAAWAMQRWLEEFAYRIPLQSWMFLLAAVLVATLTLLTVCIQAMRAALANPARSLRAE